MKTIIIVDNLVNDYCGYQSHFTEKNVNIGKQMIEKIIGIDAEFGTGPLPSFLKYQHSQQNTDLVFFRDLYKDDDQIHQEYLERLGEHCIKGTAGADFIEPIKEIVLTSDVVNCEGLAFPIAPFREIFKKLTNIDLFDTDGAHEAASNIRFLLTGFHTERRIFSVASILKNLFGFQHVAVFAHFLASLNKESHFTSLRYQFPDNLIHVLSSIDELEEFLDQKLDYLHPFGLEAVNIQPKAIDEQLRPEQKKIVKSICMHWTEATLKPLSGGFSGSALFLANGKQGSSSTEPMVIKIDNHHPIQLEIKGYNLVKDLLGKHIPTFTFPVSVGQFTGIGMELAAMEGMPNTLQDFFEDIVDDYGMDNFLKLFDRTLNMLKERVYHNTLVKKRVAPFRHFMLHISQQEKWLAGNIENLKRHETEHVDVFPEVVQKMFNLVRKNDDSLQTAACIGHGDLNFANVIVDGQANIWAIDWTHANVHPLEIDFAKMENDLKFVMSKELILEDLPKLRKMENYLLTNLEPESLDSLSEDLQFIKWDLRFKKIYLAIKKLRNVFFELKKQEDWIVYKIALLRYALHTLSFDKSIGWGECSPTQLWYAFLSVDSLLFELVGDDFHLKIRGEKPDNYPARFRIQIDEANWKFSPEKYNPPYYVSEEVLANSHLLSADGFADPEDQWEFENLIDWGRQYQRNEEGKPLNPVGRTGIQGRGNLGLWGSNPMVMIIPVRLNNEGESLDMLVDTESELQELIGVHLRRGETLDSAVNRAKEKLGNVSHYKSAEIHSGYLYDPRQTDNAWVETKAYLLYWHEENGSEEAEKDNGKLWKTLDHVLINNLYSSHGSIVRKAVQFLYDESWNKEAFVFEILDKTG
jgi:ADP-ribose pyrophosphatase